MKTLPLIWPLVDILRRGLYPFMKVRGRRNEITLFYMHGHWSIYINKRLSPFVHSFVRSYVTILPHSGGSKMFVNISVNSCSGSKMIPKLEEGRRGGEEEG